jgi:hypothetical protein
MRVISKIPHENPDSQYYVDRDGIGWRAGTIPLGSIISRTGSDKRAGSSGLLALTSQAASCAYRCLSDRVTASSLSSNIQ